MWSFRRAYILPLVAPILLAAGCTKKPHQTCRTNDDCREDEVCQLQSAKAGAVGECRKNADVENDGMWESPPIVEDMHMPSKRDLGVFVDDTPSDSTSPVALPVVAETTGVETTGTSNSVSTSTSTTSATSDTSATSTSASDTSGSPSTTSTTASTSTTAVSIDEPVGDTSANETGTTAELKLGNRPD